MCVGGSGASGTEATLGREAPWPTTRTRFGTFITPQNPRLEDVVGVAQLTERTGLDLVSFQDHPYQPAFLDTWTLLSWVAARTETRMNALIRARPRTVEELDRGSGVIDEAASAAGRDPREVRGS